MKFKELLLISKYFISPKKRMFFIFVSITVFASFFEVISVYFIIPIVNIFMGQSIPNNFLKRFMFFDNELLNYSIILLILSFFLSQIRILNNYIRLSIVQKIKIYWEFFLINIILKAKFINIKKYPEGELFFINNEAISSAISSIEVISILISSILHIIIFTGFLFYLSVKYTLIFVPVSFIIYFIIRMVNKYIVFESSEKMHKALNQKNIFLHEIISGLKAIKIYLAEKSFSKLYNNSITTVAINRIKIHFSRSVISEFINIIPFLSIGLAGLFLSTRNNSMGSLNYGIIGGYVLILIKLFPKVSSLSDLYLSLISLYPNSRKVYNFIDQEKIKFNDKDEEIGKEKLKEMDDIKFNNISFAYSGNPVLKNISFSIKKGETVAIVGESGSGKSTLINILLKLLAVQKGNIKIGKQNLAGINRASYFEKIGFVSQDIFLFHDTVRKNILIFRNNIKDEQIHASLKNTNISGFINKAADGIDFFIENNGANLSGGQKQRLAIARAMVSRPELIILDEATNALDNINETKILQTIKKSDNNPTIIIVAHRLTSIIDADKIIVIDKGKIAEIGKFKKLLAKKGIFYDLYQNRQKED